MNGWYQSVIGILSSFYRTEDGPSTLARDRCAGPLSHTPALWKLLSIGSSHEVSSFSCGRKGLKATTCSLGLEAASSQGHAPWVGSRGCFGWSQCQSLCLRSPTEPPHFPAVARGPGRSPQPEQNHLTVAGCPRGRCCAHCHSSIGAKEMRGHLLPPGGWGDPGASAGWGRGSGRVHTCFYSALSSSP